MDLNAVIEKHREALRRIVAGLVAMLEFGAATLVSRGFAGAGGMAPRHLHRAILKMLRPAESAARRLVIVLARGIVVTPPRPRQARPTKPKPTSIFVRDGVGTGIVLRQGAPVPAHLAHLVPRKAAARPLSFPLLDPLKRRSGRRRRPAAAGVPRISIAEDALRLAVPSRKPPLPDDPLDAGRLGRRLAALAGALDDLPGQAKRFARWKARRDRALAAGRIHRVSALRGGRPPGGRLSRYEPDAPRRSNIRDVDEILAHAHALAHYALRPDTS
ncbi:hypothetical protein RB623_02090 [Mesorhizobium sp. LHD-90]|uniref:hypothetical protein n=1 Tax=Mesorhizobium sp. LHD-90 TaxID=3071414 RepID=UPI0027DF6153|nr:hypothetical protein [Mesorhizobium sp. LHD-90]MDQ6432841.1 hypothetical protein [Mesorhizobium sp. LHD-90]